MFSSVPNFHKSYNFVPDDTAQGDIAGLSSLVVYKQLLCN